MPQSTAQQEVPADLHPFGHLPELESLRRSGATRWQHRATRPPADFVPAFARRTDQYLPPISNAQMEALPEPSGMADWMAAQDRRAAAAERKREERRREAVAQLAFAVAHGWVPRDPSASSGSREPATSMDWDRYDPITVPRTREREAYVATAEVSVPVAAATEVPAPAEATTATNDPDPSPTAPTVEESALPAGPSQAERPAGPAPEVPVETPTTEPIVEASAVPKATVEAAPTGVAEATPVIQGPPGPVVQEPTPTAAPVAPAVAVNITPSPFAPGSPTPAPFVTSRPVASDVDSSPFHPDAPTTLYEIRCGLCATEFRERDAVSSLNCRHFFHTKCLTEWYEYMVGQVRGGTSDPSRFVCPYCRVRIDRAEKMVLRAPTPPQSVAASPKAAATPKAAEPQHHNIATPDASRASSASAQSTVNYPWWPEEEPATSGSFHAHSTTQLPDRLSVIVDWCVDELDWRKSSQILGSKGERSWA